jgi:hypothetical protein
MFMAAPGNDLAGELAMVRRSTPCGTALQLGEGGRTEAPAQLEQAGDILHAAAEKRQHGHSDQGEKQTRAYPGRQGQQQSSDQNGKYRYQELDCGHAPINGNKPTASG